MSSIPNPSGSESPGEKSGETRDFKSPAEAKQFFKDLIAKANSVPITQVFKFYGIKISEQNRKIICPFNTKHKEGRDGTASFLFYPETNSFWCFGCKTGTRCCDFVAAKENISRAKAAYKIIDLYGSDATIDNGENEYAIDYPERLEILIEFSDFVREFIQVNKDNSEALKYVETLTAAFDKMNSKHKLDNAAIKSLILKIKGKVSEYTSCHQF